MDLPWAGIRDQLMTFVGIDDGRRVWTPSKQDARVAAPVFDLCVMCGYPESRLPLCHSGRDKSRCRLTANKRQLLDIAPVTAAYPEIILEGGKRNYLGHCWAGNFFSRTARFWFLDTLESVKNLTWAAWICADVITLLRSAIASFAGSYPPAAAASNQA